MTAAEQPLLQIRDLRIEVAGPRGPRAVVDGADLEAGAGDLLAVVGESGSGKSMTMAAVLGLLPRPAARLAAGSIRFAGTDLLALGAAARRRILRRDIAFITQNSLTSLNPAYSVGRQLAGMIAFRTGAGARQSRQLAAGWLERVGISDPARVLAAYPHALSGGMRQRVVIAMAISSRPRLVIADEPTTALDTTTQKQVLDLMTAINAEYGTAFVLITHDFGVVSCFSRRVAVMHRGRVVESGPTRAVLDAPRHDYSRALIAAVPQLDLAG